MAAKKDRKGNGPKNGPKDGRGDSKSIAFREGLKLTASPKKAPKPGFWANSDVPPVVPVADYLSGDMAIGHHVNFVGDAGEIRCELTNDGLVLISTTVAELAPFVRVAPNVYVKPWQLVKEDFKSPLPGNLAKKQDAMWDAIGAAIGDDGLEVLYDRLEAEKLETRKPVFVGESADLWRSTIIDAASALGSMSATKPAVFYVGKKGDAAAGLILKYFWNHDKRNLNIEAIHVGAKHPLAGKITQGTVIWCTNGWLPESLNHSSANDLLQFILKLGHDVKDPILDGAHKAHQRIKDELAAQKKPMLTVVGAKTPALLAPKTDASVATTVTPAPAPVQAPVPAPAPVAQPAPVATASPAEIGRAHV